MAHNAYRKPSGDWSAITTLLPVDMSFFDAAQFKSLNGDDGGAWAPAAPIYLGGQGFIFDTVSGGGLHKVLSPLRVDGAGTIVYASGARLILESGYPTYSAPRTLTRAVPTATAGGSGWYTWAGWLLGNSTPGAFGLIPLNPHIADGSTLTQLVFNYVIPTPHGALPAIYGYAEVVRVDSSGNLVLLHPSLQSLPATTPASVAIYEAAGGVQTCTLALTINNVVDKTQYNYVLFLVDENGANALVGTKIYVPTITMTLADMRPW